MAIFFSSGSGRLGIVTSRTPFLKLAETFSVFTSFGRANVLLKLDEERSFISHFVSSIFFCVSFLTAAKAWAYNERTNGKWSLL